MKIISNYKDYYDFLSGIYGVDPKIVLDRRKHVNPQILFPQKIILFICGKKIEGFFDGNSYYYGDDLNSIGTRMKNPSYYRLWGSGLKEVVRIKYRPRDFEPIETIDINPYMVDADMNDEEDCPIIYGSIHHHKDFPGGFYPKLKDFNLSSILPPHEIYQMLTQWLSNKINETENIVDTRNDKLRIESKGFDNKRSFRPKMKK